ncbi:MAG: hypothetical protein K1X89_32055, partial [Myxococcaceae bacterium]|nr:hypothetical protein [Myxococcaceae bacterium]
GGDASGGGSGTGPGGGTAAGGGSPAGGGVGGSAGGGNAGGGSPGGSGGTGPIDDVVVVSTALRGVSASGPTVLLRPVVDGGLGALIPLPDGGMRELLGAPLADGGYEIRGVDAGRFLVRFSNGGATPTFVWTAQRSVDFGDEVSGRVGAVRATSATPVTLAFPSLPAAVSQTDSFQLTSFAAGFNVNDLKLRPDFAFGLGDGGSYELRYDHLGEVLVDAAKAEGAVLVASPTYRFVGDAGTLVREASQFARFPTFGTSSGQATRFTATPATVPRTMVGLTLARSQLSSPTVLSAVGSPDASVMSTSVFIDEAPSGIGTCGFGCGTLQLGQLIGQAGNTSDETTSLSFADPGVAPLYAMAYTGYSVPVVRGPGQVETQSAVLLQRTPLGGTLPMLTVGPALLPPTGATLAADSLRFTPMTVTAGYLATLARLSTGGIPATQLAVFVLGPDQSSVPLPPDLVEPGEDHVALVAAVNGPRRFDEAPGRLTPPLSYAQGVSKVLRVGNRRACSTGTLTVGPRGGPDTCSYGYTCTATGCAPVPAATCAEASAAPLWNYELKSVPVIVSLSASLTPFTSPTECSGSGPAGLITVGFAGPQPLLGAGTAQELASKVSVRLTAGGAPVAASFFRMVPAAGATSGTFVIGLCGQTGNAAVQLVTTGAGNSWCVSW